MLISRRKYLHSFPLFRMAEPGICVLLQVLKSSALYLVLSSVADFCQLLGSVLQCIQDWNGAEWVKCSQGRREGQCPMPAAPRAALAACEKPWLTLITKRSFFTWHLRFVCNSVTHCL